MKRLLFIAIVAVLGLTACGPSAEELVQQGKAYLENDDCEKAVKCFGKAVEKGNAKAMYEIGLMYYDGICVDKDHESAATWFKHAADIGYPDAQNKLAWMYWAGNGVEKNDEKAVKWAQLALGIGEYLGSHYWESYYVLGTCYVKGKVLPQDNKNGVKYLQKAADMNILVAPVADKILLPLYLEGEGVQDDEKAITACCGVKLNIDRAEAMNSIGMMYYNGEGVDKNTTKAFNWFKRAANAGNATAQYNTAVAYYFGIGVNKSLTESRKWLKMAAENGHADAQYNLGGAYIGGEGVPQNMTEAKYWLQKAADQGNEDAKEFLRNLAKAEAMEKEKAAAEAKAKTEAKAKEEARRNAKRTGVFSVGSNKKVIFSKGNLQYQASTKTWRFAEHQWDIIGSENSKISENYSGWIDLFGWGTSGYNGENPWTTSKWKTDYGNGEMDIAGTNYDWGVYNTISNGGGKSWRTLTRDEWVYVFNTRCTSSGIRYAKATVNGVNGVILLPDNWSSSNYSLSNTNKTYASFNSNRISQSDWTNKFESNGAVFLPAAGWRYVTNVSRVGSFGYYWSASYRNSSSVRYVYFEEGGLSPDNWNGRYYGQSVRLVCPAEN